MPTWLTGEFVAVWIARSATERPRKIQTSPVRVSSTASSSDRPVDVSCAEDMTAAYAARSPPTVPHLPLRTPEPLEISLERTGGRTAYARAMQSNWWKVLGLAGVASVVATGAVIARNERQRRAYSPDEIRERLHERHARAQQDRPGATG